MLKDPFLNAPYQPSIREFLGTFDIYDREETLGVELSTYDINSRPDREKLIKKYISDKKQHLSYRHRYLLLQELDYVLANEKYDFISLFEDDPNEYNSMPYGWDDMKDPRAFFEDIHRILNNEWKADILKAANEDQNTW